MLSRNHLLQFVELILLIGGLSGRNAAAEAIQVRFSSSSQPEARVALRQSNEIIYINLNDFAAALGIRCYINQEKRKLQYTLGGTTLKWTADNAFVVVGTQVRQLPAEVLLREDQYWAPLDAFLALFGSVYEGDVAFEPTTRVMTVRPGNDNIYALQYDLKENGTLVRFFCTNKLAFSPPVLRGEVLSFSCQNAALRKGLLEKVRPTGAVQGVALEVLPLEITLNFTLSEPVIEYALWQDEGSNQLNLSLVTRLIEPVVQDSELAGQQEQINELGEILEQDQNKWRIDCVVIDPGHGGKDPGAIGSTGLLEKEATLGIALRLKQLLEKNTKLKVVLTRQDDRFIGLNERTRIANQKGGKLFISIHCNSLKSGGGSGFETFFLKPARNQKAMEVALQENAVIKYENSKNQYQDLTEENYILLAMAQSEFARESESLASMVQAKLRMATGLHDRGVDQAGFYVLVGASMPAILVETAFLSNKHEEKLLRTKKFRQQVAQGLYESIMNFVQQTEVDLRNASAEP